MSNQEKNILISLPEKVKLEIKERALLRSFKTANDILDHHDHKNAIQLLRQALEDTILSYESSAWFKDEEIKKLNEVIQRKHDTK